MLPSLCLKRETFRSRQTRRCWPTSRTLDKELKEAIPNDSNIEKENQQLKNTQDPKEELESVRKVKATLPVLLSLKSPVNARNNIRSLCP